MNNAINSPMLFNKLKDLYNQLDQLSDSNACKNEKLSLMIKIYAIIVNIEPDTIVTTIDDLSLNIFITKIDFNELLNTENYVLSNVFISYYGNVDYTLDIVHIYYKFIQENSVYYNLSYSQVIAASYFKIN